MMRKCIAISASIFLAVLFFFDVCARRPQDVFCAGLTPKGLREKKLTIVAENKDAKIIESLTGKPLVIPVQHIASLKELNSGNVHLLASMFSLAAQSASTLKMLKGPYNYASFHTGARGGQTVFHLHMHMDHAENPVRGLMPLSDCRCQVETKYAKIQEGKTGELLILPHCAIASLDDPAMNAQELAYVLLDLVRYLNRNHPQKDYATDMYTTTTAQGQPTVIIAVQLY